MNSKPKPKSYLSELDSSKYSLSDPSENILPDYQFGATRAETMAGAKAVEPTSAGTADAARGAAQTMASGGNATDIAASGLMASGNPAAMGAGAGLAVLSMQQKRKDNEAKMQWQAKQARLEKQQQAISRLMNVSSSLRNL